MPQLLYFFDVFFYLSLLIPRAFCSRLVRMLMAMGILVVVGLEALELGVRYSAGSGVVCIISNPTNHVARIALLINYVEHVNKYRYSVHTVLLRTVGAGRLYSRHKKGYHIIPNETKQVGPLT